MPDWVNVLNYTDFHNGAYKWKEIINCRIENPRHSVPHYLTTLALIAFLGNARVER